MLQYLVENQNVEPLKTHREKRTKVGEGPSGQ
jgi:hypothetical protein